MTIRTEKECWVELLPSTVPAQIQFNTKTGKVRAKKRSDSVWKYEEGRVCNATQALSIGQSILKEKF